MDAIIYERGSQSASMETYEIDELSQRLLVYLLIDGAATPDSIVNPIGANSKEEIETRYDNSLSPDAAGLIKKREGNQTLEGNVLIELSLTESGENFVYNHKDSLSMTADLEELAKTVSSLEIELSYLRYRLEELNIRLEE